MKRAREPGKKAVEKPAAAKSILTPEKRGRPRKLPSGPASAEEQTVVDLVGDAEPDHPLHETWNSESGRWEPVREAAQEAPDAAAAREPLAGAGA